MENRATATLPDSRVEAFVEIDHEHCHQLELILTREWLETDGRGGYASSTALMCATRRYHGLLVAPYPGNLKRHVFLSRFEETLQGGGRSFPISIARYPGLWSPLGHTTLESFRLIPYPSFVYHIGGAEILREIMMVQGAPLVITRYRVTGQQSEVTLALRPMLAYRDADKLTCENIDLNPRVERLKTGIRLQPYLGLPALSITTNHRRSRFDADPLWYRRVEYQKDLARGYDGHEDQFSPGTLLVPLEEGQDVFVAATIEDPADSPDELFARESERRRRRFQSTGRHVPGTLRRAADDYLYRAPSRLTPTGERLGVIAGYHWFGEWGRDSFISLPGLLLARGNLHHYEEALLGALPYLKSGLMPNIFGLDQQDSHYGAADAALWFARAVQLYDAELESKDRIVELFLPALIEIAESYLRGTSLELFCDPTGLLHAGREDQNVTWMDARTRKGPVTPRDGYPVEINALWYSLLRHLERLLLVKRDEGAARRWLKRRKQTGKSFISAFWLEKERHLADRVKNGDKDKSIRPNMVIAAALEFSPLSRGKRTDIVKCAEASLLTPRGLRTLAPQHADYKGRYHGNQEERDLAYHQGSVWPWLLGFYCEAYLRAYGFREPKRVDSIRHLLEDGFDHHLLTHGMGQISEVFDGDPPHRPGGTIAQAWNVAELLRAFRLLEAPPL